jgi:aldehyde:ferredoxin oxidoreductase
MNALFVDLTHLTLGWSEINPDAIAHYLGGRGLGTRFLYDQQPPGTNPLGVENLLTFWTSPLMATGAFSTVKLCGVTRSPATGTILMSLMGGYFGPRLRMAGADALIVTGKASQPVYLLISEGQASLRSAVHLWGKTTRETTQLLNQELKLRNMQVACIGPAGENQVLFASIMSGGDAMGRGGIGAVMGSKNLKAIVAHGNQSPEIHDPSRLRKILKQIAQTYRESEVVKQFGQYGTTSHVDDENYFGIYPSWNYRSGKFPQYEKINHEHLYKNYVNKRVTCFACAVRCRREAEVKSGPLASRPTEGPEYETLWSLGGNCGNTNLEAIILANELCLQFGLDTISTGMVISFAMECFENGLLTFEQTGGLDLNFGNSESMLTLIQRIVYRQGVGNLLANGTRQAAAALGHEAEQYAMQVKGLELAGYDPRGAKGLGLGYATSPRGGCHERGFLTGEVFGTPPGVNRLAYEGKGRLVQTTQDTVAVKDALGFCVLASAGTSLEAMAEMFSAVTGIETSLQQLLLAGERITNVERLFNLREGFTRADDTLPRRLMQEPIAGPHGEPQVVNLERLLEDYYAVRGWDEQGRPTYQTLERLDLGASPPGSPVLCSLPDEISVWKGSK